ncbi:MAG: hypothetical protein M3P18_01735, partial [Actinomycetota bacterium]|nr:hypothetical protein [Actinomycetota bacterium]
SPDADVLLDNAKVLGDGVPDYLRGSRDVRIHGNIEEFKEVLRCGEHDFRSGIEGFTCRFINNSTRAHLHIVTMDVRVPSRW